jgi:hypothetical protein
VDVVFHYPTFADAYKVAALDVMNKDAHAQPVPRLMPMLTSVADPNR